jgi:ABC-type transporter Mla subunit MlaD
VSDDKRYIGKVDVTPTWADIVEILLNAVENGNAKQQEAARAEIRRMATIADAYNRTQRQITAALESGTTALDELVARVRGGDG